MMASNALSMDSIFEDSGRPASQYRKITLNVNGVVQTVMVPLDDGVVEQAAPTPKQPASTEARGTKRSLTASEIVFGNRKAQARQDNEDNAAQSRTQTSGDGGSLRLSSGAGIVSSQGSRNIVTPPSTQTVVAPNPSTTTGGCVPAVMQHLAKQGNYLRTPTPPLRQSTTNPTTLPNSSTTANVSDLSLQSPAQVATSFAQFQLPSSLFNIQPGTQNQVLMPVVPVGSTGNSTLLVPNGQSQPPAVGSVTRAHQVTLLPSQPVQPQPLMITSVDMSGNKSSTAAQPAVLSAPNAVVLPTGAATFAPGSLVATPLGARMPTSQQQTVMQVAPQQRVMQVTPQAVPHQPALLQTASQQAVVFPPVTSSSATASMVPVQQGMHLPVLMPHTQTLQMAPASMNVSRSVANQVIAVQPGKHGTATMPAAQNSGGIAVTVAFQPIAGQTPMQYAIANQPAVSVSTALTAGNPIIISPPTTTSVSSVHLRATVTTTSAKQQTDPASLATQISGLMKAANSNNRQDEARLLDSLCSSITKSPKTLLTNEKENADGRYVKILPRVPGTEISEPPGRSSGDSKLGQSECRVSLERVGHKVNHDEAVDSLVEVPSKKSEESSSRCNKKEDAVSLEKNVRAVKKIKKLTKLKDTTDLVNQAPKSPQFAAKQSPSARQNTFKNVKESKGGKRRKKKTTDVVPVIKPCSVVLERLNLRGRKRVKMWDILPDLYPDIFDPDDY